MGSEGEKLNRSERGSSGAFTSESHVAERDSNVLGAAAEEKMKEDPTKANDPSQSQSAVSMNKNSQAIVEKNSSVENFDNRTLDHVTMSMPSQETEFGTDILSTTSEFFLEYSMS